MPIAVRCSAELGGTRLRSIVTNTEVAPRKPLPPFAGSREVLTARTLTDREIEDCVEKSIESEFCLVRGFRPGDENVDIRNLADLWNGIDHHGIEDFDLFTVD